MISVIPPKNSQAEDHGSGCTKKVASHPKGDDRLALTNGYC